LEAGLGFRGLINRRSHLDVSPIMRLGTHKAFMKKILYQDTTEETLGNKGEKLKTTFVQSEVMDTP